MNAPQIVILLLYAISGSVYLVKHGQPQGKYNFFGWALGTIVNALILEWGGFWS